MNILVYAEKSSDGKEIAKGLSLNGSINLNNGYATVDGFDGNNITVFWGAGHFYGLKTPKDLGYTYNMKTLPILPKKIELGEDLSFENKKNLLINGKNLLTNSKFELLVFAGDAGREGLAILDRIYKESGSTLPIEYIWKGDSSKEEVRKHWKNRLKGNDKLLSGEIIDGLKESANQRAIADWKIGMNFSQLYTLYNKLANDEFISFRIGRVITPTLNMIKYREEQINDFKTEKYYKLNTSYNEGFNSTYYKDIKDKESHKIFNNEELISIYNELTNEKEGKVIKYSKTTSLSNPSFGLNGSNIKMSKILKISPKKVLDLVEEMYNKDGIMSYPRVESVHITEGEYEDIKKTIKFLQANVNKIPTVYKEVINYIVNNDFKPTIPVVNNKKIIEGHGAFHVKLTKGENSKKILIDLLNGDNNKSKLLIKILNNNLSFFLPKAEKTNFEIIVDIAGFNFMTKESFLSRKGFKILEETTLEEIPEYLNNIKENDIVNIDKLEREEGFTKPPSRINTDSILMYMSHPNKLFDIQGSENELYNIIEKTEGIGQPATRQIIIENIINEKYVEIKKGAFFMTEKGIKVLNTVDEQIKDVLLTAKLEKGLNDIAFGNNKENIESLGEFIDTYIKGIIGKKLTKDIMEKYEEKYQYTKQLVEIKSPEGYNLYMKENKDQKGKYYVTSDDNRTKDGKPIFYSLYDPVQKKLINNSVCNTELTCPKCGGKMNVFKSPKSGELYIECCSRKIGSCDFVSKYDISNDKIINSLNFVEGLKCEKCGGKIHVRKSAKNGKHYGICEHNNKDKECDFIKEYDRNTNTFMLPIYMRNSKGTGIKFNNEELYENDKTYFSKSGNITIWKVISGKEITISILEDLIQNKITSNVISGFTSKKGSNFSAKLKLVGNNVKFDF